MTCNCHVCLELLLKQDLGHQAFNKAFFPLSILFAWTLTPRENLNKKLRHNYFDRKPKPQVRPHLCPLQSFPPLGCLLTF